MKTNLEVAQHNAQMTIVKAALDGLEKIYIDEFSAVPGGLMAPMFAGLKEVIRLGLFDRARVLVDSVTTPPPGITEARMDAVKDQIKALFP